MVSEYLGLSLTLAFVGALGGLALTIVEQTRAANGGGPDLPNPLGLMVSSLIAWTGFALTALLAFLTGSLAHLVIFSLLAFAIVKVRGLGADISRYAALRLPLALGGLLLSIALWLGTFALVELPQ